MSLKQNDIYNETMVEGIAELEDIMLDAEQTFNADKRDGFDGRMSVSQVENAYTALGGII